MFVIIILVCSSLIYSVAQQKEEIARLKKELATARQEKQQVEDKFKKELAFYKEREHRERDRSDRDRERDRERGDRDRERDVDRRSTRYENNPTIRNSAEFNRQKSSSQNLDLQDDNLLFFV